MSKYTLRPLRWEGNDERGWGASTPFGSYKVDKRWTGDESGDWPEGPWYWGYCFDEYYDEENTDCESPEDGKRRASEHWVARILPALEECK